jgi:hypothetical protein
MTVYVVNIRKDGKLTVRYGFDNGVRLTKIRTPEQLAQDRDKGAEFINGLEILKVRGL